MKKRLLISILLISNIIPFALTTSLAYALPKETETIDNVADEEKQEETEEEKDNSLHAILSYKKGKKEYIYKIPKSKFEELQIELRNYGTPEEYFVPAEDIVIEEEVLVYPEPQETTMPWETWDEHDWKNYNEFIEAVNLDENTTANWMEVFCWAMGEVPLDKIYRDNNGYYHYNPDFKDPNLEPRIEIRETVIKNTVTYTDFILKHDLGSMYDKSSKFIVPSTSFNDFITYLNENYETIKSMDDISKEEVRIDVENNTCFFEIGLDGEYLTKFEDVELERAQPAIDYLNKCEVGEDCKIKYIKVENNVRIERILNISREDLLRKIIPMLYDKTKVQPFPKTMIDPNQEAVPPEEVAKG